MSKKDAALKLALEALESLFSGKADEHRAHRCSDAIIAIREALAEQPAQQEPVAYAVYHRMGGSKTLHWPEQHSEHGDHNEYRLVPLYEHPPALVAEPHKQPAQQQEPEYKGWYCAHCQRDVDGSEVTYREQHIVCGRVITDDLPPKAQQQERKRVGDSRFESWFSEDFDPKEKGTKQQIREAYEAGMNDTSPQPAQQQEPVAWLYPDNLGRKIVWLGAKKPIIPRPSTAEPLYTSPPASKPWVGLTDEEYKEAEKAVWAVIAFDDTEKKANREFYEAIEAKLREKNA